MTKLEELKAAYAKADAAYAAALDAYEEELEKQNELAN